MGCVPIGSGSRCGELPMLPADMRGILLQEEGENLFMGEKKVSLP